MANQEERIITTYETILLFAETSDWTETETLVEQHSLRNNMVTNLSQLLSRWMFATAKWTKYKKLRYC